MGGMTSREQLETDRQDRSLANKNALWLKRHRRGASFQYKIQGLKKERGASDEQAISWKHSAGRVELGNAGGNGCRTRTAATGATAAATRSGLHLDRLLHWCERGYFKRTEQT